jgi:hypothetical protein
MQKVAGGGWCMYGGFSTHSKVGTVRGRAPGIIIIVDNYYWSRGFMGLLLCSSSLFSFRAFRRRWLRTYFYFCSSHSPGLPCSFFPSSAPERRVAVPRGHNKYHYPKKTYLHNNKSFRNGLIPAFFLRLHTQHRLQRSTRKLPVLSPLVRRCKWAVLPQHQRQN